jgi:hypothetical protein
LILSQLRIFRWSRVLQGRFGPLASRIRLLSAMCRHARMTKARRKRQIALSPHGLDQKIGGTS